MISRLGDQPRPFVWSLLRHFSTRYRTAHEARALPDWLRIVLRRTVYIPDRRLLYVVNSKAASSSLDALMTDLGRAVAGTQRETTALRFPSPRWREIVDAIGDERTYKFTFVRHPVARAVSAFTNIFVDRRNDYLWRHLPYLRRVGLRLGDNSSGNFDRFIDYVEDALAESPAFADLHLRPQVRIVWPDAVKYSRIGKVETLVADVSATMAEAGVADYRDSMLAWSNRSGERAGAVIPTPGQISRLGRIYAEDFDRFGYAIE